MDARRALWDMRAHLLLGLVLRGLTPLAVTQGSFAAEEASHALTPPRPRANTDFARKVRVDVAGLTPAQLEDKLREMVSKGETMPRSLHQSIEPLLQKTVVD